MTLAYLPLAIFSFCMIYAAITDSAAMRISNKLCLAIIVSFVLMTPFAWAGWGVFLEHLAVGGIFFAAGFIMFAVGGLGGGDAKMMAATALWWTWSDVLSYVLMVTFLGGVLAIALIAGRKYVPVSLATGSLTSRLFSDEKKLPYGIALGLGALIVLPSSDILQRALFGG